jgi:hypothetical protein
MRLRRLPLTAVLLAVLMSGCSTSGAAPTPSNTPNVSGSSGPHPSIELATPTVAAPTVAANALFGTWRRLGSCTQFFQAVRKAGTMDEIPEWIAGGVYLASPETAARADDPCVGARSVYHSHSFSPNLQFNSYDEKGEQADDGRYELVGNDTIVFGVVKVRYRIDASDHLSFTDVSFPPCPTPTPPSISARSSVRPEDEWTCRDNAGWAISAFYPGSYERVSP